MCIIDRAIDCVIDCVANWVIGWRVNSSSRICGRVVVVGGFSNYLAIILACRLANTILLMSL